MTAIVLIPRSDWIRRSGVAYETAPPPGQRSSTLLRARRPIVVELRCPGCQHVETLAEPLHRIESSGLVYPAILCMVPRCGFDGIISLAGWDPDVTAVDSFPGLRFGIGGAS